MKIEPIYKGFKTELHPNNKQNTLLWKNCGAARFTYNWAISLLQEDYKNKSKQHKINAIYLHKELCKLKKDQFPWMYEVSKCSPQFALRNLVDAYKRFFKKEAIHPPKKKKKSLDNDNKFSVDGSVIVTHTHIQIPKIGKIRLKEHGYIPTGIATKASISRQGNRWFVSLNIPVDMVIEDSKPLNEECLGIDRGIKSFAYTSDNEEFKSPKKFKDKQRKLVRLQRKFNRRKKGSKNRQKALKQIKNVHYKIACDRKDITHKTTSFLTKTKLQDNIVIEKLNTRGMMKNHKIARSTANSNYCEFERQLNYKSKWNNKNIIQVSPFYPSSKTCSCCGNKKDDLTLKNRTYECVKCGNVIDRDYNASLNLKKCGEEFLKQNTVSSTGINACGDITSWSGAIQKKVIPKKQENNKESTVYYLKV